MGEGRYGNAILAHHAYELRAEGILPALRGEVRAAQWLRLALGHGHLDVVNTHLSLHFLERLVQFRALFSEAPPERGNELLSAIFDPACPLDWESVELRLAHSEDWLRA